MVFGVRIFFNELSGCKGRDFQRNVKEKKELYEKERAERGESSGVI